MMELFQLGVWLAREGHSLGVPGDLNVEIFIEAGEDVI